MSGSAGRSRSKNKSIPKPFPVMTAQSYLPGAVAGTGGYPPLPVGANQYPVIAPNSYLPPPPPSYNPMNSSMGRLPPPPSYNPMNSSIRRPPPISYPNSMPMIQRPAPFYNPHHHRPMPISRRYRSRSCRPIVHIIKVDSCSSISTCSSISSCSPRRHRSCSYSKDCRTNQQQPIILLPIQCQQQSAITSRIQGQPQPIILPPINSAPIMIQPLNTMPQVVSTGRPQQIQAGPIQYVQARPTSASSSQLQSISLKPSSSKTSQHVLVNSTNKKQTTDLKPIQ